VASQSQQPAPGTRRRQQLGISQLASLTLLALIALRLAGVINWSWWWVLAPLWIILAQPALAAGCLLALCARQQWLCSRFRRRPIWLAPSTAPPTGAHFAAWFESKQGPYEPASDTRIVLGSPHPGQQNDPVVDHPGQPGPYIAPDGTYWTWQNDQAWRRAATPT
jgi:hypothetical protein